MILYIIEDETSEYLISNQVESYFNPTRMCWQHYETEGCWQTDLAILESKFKEFTKREVVFERRVVWSYNHGGELCVS